MAERVLVLDGNPGKHSFCRAMAEAYTAGARDMGKEVRLLHLSEMRFDPDMGEGYASTKAVEPDLEIFQLALEWCQHLVIVQPLWWGMMPAKLKGLFDRALLPGFAFSYDTSSPMPKKLMKGRSAEVLVTADTPVWFLHLVYRAGYYRALKHQVLGLCGISPVRFHTFAMVRSSDHRRRDRWLEKAARLGAAR